MVCAGGTGIDYPFAVDLAKQKAQSSGGLRVKGGRPAWWWCFSVVLL
ncbi:hypothetical protein ACNKHT_12380 [Shigella flexneri]